MKRSIHDENQPSNSIHHVLLKSRLWTGTSLYSSQNADLFETRGLVAGSWKASEKTTSFPVTEPSSGKVLGYCSGFLQQDFSDAIEEADRGYRKFWSSTTAAERGRLLRKWYELIIENAEDSISLLAILISLENGKTLPEARAEINMAASYVSWFWEEAIRAYGDVIPSSYSETAVLTFKEPVGVCGIITPWNFPAAMITRKIAPAFAAGCAVVIKPPSETPFSALALAKLAIQAGIPASIIHVIPTKVHQESLELAKNPKVKNLSFTGSTRVGKMLTQLAAGTMKKFSMELGGNAPFIMFDDADLDRAVEGAMASKFRCAGQTCRCANRIYVQNSVAEAFTEKLVQRTSQLALGKGLAQGTTMGPLVNAAAVKKVEYQINDALSKGAVVKFEKNPARDGFFFEPTIITGATKEMEVANDETFGPLAAIFTFQTEDEVVSLANDTELGLAGYFYSRDVSRVLRVARRLECGMIGINTGLITACESPFGGTKESGMGIEASKYSLAEYRNVKGVTIGGIVGY